MFSEGDVIPSPCQAREWQTQAEGLGQGTGLVNQESLFRGDWDNAIAISWFSAT